jgi:Protein of unknown function (DUF4236)
MGLRFQRRIKVLPGLRLNLSRSGVGFSVGARGAHVGITARGQRYTSIGLPGSGLSWREYHNPHHSAGDPSAQCDLCRPGHAHVHGGGCALLVVAGLVVWWLLWLISRP